MIATDLVLRHAVNPARLVLFSGTLLSSDDWNKLAEQHDGCPVLQSHGRQDMVLPFTPSQWLRDMLEANDFTVEFIPFNGGHEIPMEVLSAFVRTLEQLA